MRAAALFRRLLTPITPGAKRAVVILFVLTFALAGANLLFTVRQVTGNDRKFCQVVTGVTTTPVTRPADPAANPSREKQFELYVKFVRLGRDLGC